MIFPHIPRGRAAAFLVLVSLLALQPVSARAGYASVFGIGAESISTGSTSFLHGEPTPFNAYGNPALLGYLSKAELALAVMSTDVNLLAFGRVVVNESGTFGTFDTSGVLGGRGQMIGLGIPLGKPSRPLTIGVVAYFSSDSVSRVSGPPVNQPFYPIYNDTARNAAYTVSAGYRIWNELSVGFAANTSLISVADYRIVNAAGGSFSASTVEVKSAFSPGYALSYDFKKGSPEGEGIPLTLGLMRRGKSELKTKLKANAEVQGIPVIGELTSFPHFSPAEWVETTSYQFSPVTTVALEVARIEWSEYKNPVGTGNLNSFVFGNGNESAGFKDVTVPRVGVQHKLFANGLVKEYALRAGYFFYPSPVPNQTGNSNFADSDRHAFSGGLGLGVLNPWMEEDSLLHIDLFAQYNKLASRKVVKNRPTDLGGPGYTIGGNIWVYGLQTRLEF